MKNEIELLYDIKDDMLYKNITERDIVVYWNIDSINNLNEDWVMHAPEVVKFGLNITPDKIILLNGVRFYLISKNLKTPEPQYQIKVEKCYLNKSEALDFAKYYLERYKESRVLDIALIEYEILENFLKINKS